MPGNYVNRGLRRTKEEMAVVQAEIDKLIAEGVSYREIARRLDVNLSVVSRHADPASRPEVVRPVYPIPFDLNRRATGKEAMGILAEAKATVWFMAHGYVPSKPAMACAYDMLVESEQGIKRVQVKYTNQRAASGGFLVNLHRQAYNAETGRGDRKVCYMPGEVDLFFIVAGEGASEAYYLIPYEAVEGKLHIVLDTLYAPYRVHPKNGDGSDSPVQE